MFFKVSSTGCGGLPRFASYCFFPGKRNKKRKICPALHVGRESAGRRRRKNTTRSEHRRRKLRRPERRCGDFCSGTWSGSRLRRIANAPFLPYSPARLRSDAAPHTQRTEKQKRRHHHVVSAAVYSPQCSGITHFISFSPAERRHHNSGCGIAYTGDQEFPKS